jgi:hypothetical protein
MVYFQTKNPYLGKFREGRALEDVGIHTYFMAIWSVLWPFGIFYGRLVHVMAEMEFHKIYPTCDCRRSDRVGKVLPRNISYSAR